MLDSLIGSKTRLKLLLKFFLNTNSSAYLRGLEAELGENSNAIRLELNKLVDANLLVSTLSGNKRMYSANKRHPLVNDLHRIISKHIGIDRLIESVIGRLGNLQQAYILNDYARGIDSGIIDLLLIGEVDRIYLNSLIPKTESLINRKVRFVVFDTLEEAGNTLQNNDHLLIWGEI